jgi:hypothetical protein
MGGRACSEDVDCPGAWECDTVAEKCIRVEPADFFWDFLATSGITAAIVIVIVILLFGKKKSAD